MSKPSAPTSVGQWPDEDRANRRSGRSSGEDHMAEFDRIPPRDHGLVGDVREAIPPRTSASETVLGPESRRSAR